MIDESLLLGRKNILECTEVVMTQCLYNLGYEEEGKINRVLLKDPVSILQYQWIVIISSLKVGVGDDGRNWGPQKKKLFRDQSSQGWWAADSP